MTDWVRAEVVPADFNVSTTHSLRKATHDGAGSSDLGGDKALERAACGSSEHFEW